MPKDKKNLIDLFLLGVINNDCDLVKRVLDSNLTGKFPPNFLHKGYSPLTIAKDAQNLTEMVNLLENYGAK